MIGERFFCNTTRDWFEDWLIRTVPWPRTVDVEGGGRLVLSGLERIEGGVGAKAYEMKGYELEVKGLEEFTQGQRPIMSFQILELSPTRVEVRAWCLCPDPWPALGDWFHGILRFIGKTWPESGLAEGLAPAVDVAPAVIGGEVTTAAGIRKDREQRRADVRRLWLAKGTSETKTAFRMRAASELAVSESTIRDELRYLRETGQIKDKMSV